MSDSTNQASKTPVFTLVYLIVMSIIVAVTGLASVVAAAFSVMMLDAPGSTEQPGTIALAASVGLYPVVSLIALVSSWICYGYKQRTLACVLILLPCLNLIAGGLACYYIETYQGGSFGKP